jgi:hypothetical protein
VAAIFLKEFVTAGFKDNAAARAAATAVGGEAAGAAEEGPAQGGRSGKKDVPPLPWIHIDTGAWVGSSRTGRPEGGEALGLLALAAMLEQRYRGGIGSGSAVAM